jgi:amino acid permease
VPNPIDEDGRREIRLARYGRAIDLYQSATTGAATIMTALVLALVTLIGFAINNQSAGIALTSAIIEPVMLAVLWVYERRKNRLLDVARDIERQLGEETLSLVAALESVDSETDGLSMRWLVAGIITAVFVVHVGVTLFLLFGQGWTFSGGAVGVVRGG